MQKPLPETEHDFQALMEAVDQRLASQGVKVPARPLNAVRIVSNEYKISLPFAPVPGGMEELQELAQVWPFVERMYRWYDVRYGDRLKIDPGPGRMAFLLRGGAWVFRFPLIIGRAVIIASRAPKKISNSSSTDGNPVLLNVVDMVVDLPDGLRKVMTDDELRYIEDRFMLGLTALSQLRRLRAPLALIARADVSAAVDQIMSKEGDLGVAKYASLQAAEKLLKAAIEKAGGTYKRVHMLSELLDIAGKNGVQLSVDHLIGDLQCGGGVRYGQEHVDLEGAVRAHHASLEMVVEISDWLK